jgi:tetratricopeptide (TPR) repeat protein
MLCRPGWLICAFVLLAAKPNDGPRTAADQLWQRGQEAMRRGQADVAIDLYQQSLHVDPGYSSSHLSLAAAYVEKQQLEQAGSHLGQYLDANPEQVAVRVRYGELLLRLKRTKEAFSQFECAIATGQELTELPARDLVLCHSALANISFERNDSYHERLHRGIGCYLLAGQRALIGTSDPELPEQSLLFKAAGELTHARLENPTEARPNWYLYLVWTRLGQSHPALCRLRDAAASAPFSDLTPAERRDLESAWAKARLR